MINPERPSSTLQPQLGAPSVAVQVPRTSSAVLTISAFAVCADAIATTPPMPGICPSTACAPMFIVLRATLRPTFSTAPPVKLASLLGTGGGPPARLTRGAEQMPGVTGAAVAGPAAAITTDGPVGAA